eukprot:scaffold4756_cov116-Isochrysis_galbana.AAC.1
MVAPPPRSSVCYPPRPKRRPSRSCPLPRPESPGRAGRVGWAHRCGSATWCRPTRGSRRSRAPAACGRRWRCVPRAPTTPPWRRNCPAWQ